MTGLIIPLRLVGPLRLIRFKTFYVSFGRPLPALDAAPLRPCQVGQCETEAFLSTECVCVCVGSLELNWIAVCIAYFLANFVANFSPTFPSFFPPSSPLAFVLNQRSSPAEARKRLSLLLLLLLLLLLCLLSLLHFAGEFQLEHANADSRPSRAVGRQGVAINDKQLQCKLCFCPRSPQAKEAKEPMEKETENNIR